MKPYRYDIRKFLVISGSLALATNKLVEVGLSTIGQNSIYNGGIIASVIGLFWYLFDQHMWRWRIFKAFKISDLPDLNGTWEGTINRLGEETPHKMSMFIFQTYSKISIQTITRNSKGNSIDAGFLIDETGKNFDLVNYWLCRTKKRSEPGVDTDGVTMEDFKGLTHIDVKGFTLEDYYFTDRNTATQGKVTYKQISKKVDFNHVGLKNQANQG